MQWPREDACAGQPGMPHMLLARQQSSRTSPRTSWVRPPMRSRPHVLPRRKERARAQGGSSAGGSATSSRRRFASSYSTTSGCGTASAGRCSTADRLLVKRSTARKAAGKQHTGESKCSHHASGFLPPQVREAHRPAKAEVAASSPTELTKTAQYDLRGTHLAWATRALPVRFLW